MKNPIHRTFPREVGMYRQIVYSPRQLQFWLDKVNGIEDAYVSVYDLNFTITHLFYDFDGRFLSRVLDEVKRFYKGLRDEGYAVLPVFSGKKGFHLYIMTEEVEPPDKKVASSIIGWWQMKFIQKYKLKYYDNHVIGDVRRMARHPNTKRVNLPYWCIPLPEEFVYMTVTDIKRLAVEERPEFFQYHDGEPLPILDFEIEEMTSYEVGTNSILDGLEHVIPKNVEAFLRTLLYPCVAEEVLSPDPEHWARFEMVAQLRAYGYTPNFVAEIISRLRWNDYNPRRTWYHIQNIYQNSYLPSHPKKLKWTGRCRRDCKCKYIFKWMVE